jgi:uncharacterized membrane protein
MKEELKMIKLSNFLKKDWAILILIILGFVLAVCFYPSLPNRVPTHWNFNGVADGYVSKPLGAFVSPLTNLGIYLLLIVLPYIDPKRKNYKKFQSTYQYLKYVLVVFLLVIEVVTHLITTGAAVNSSFFIQILVSLLIIFIGNVMGRFEHNYFVGIKTPWTLANEEVWRKTHRMAAPVWVIGGILNILLTILGITFNGITSLIIILVIVIAPVVYSYVIYQKVSNAHK